MIPSQITWLTQLCLRSNAGKLQLCWTHVSLSIFLDGLLNMLQASTYTGQNPRTTRKDSQISLFLAWTISKHSPHSSLCKGPTNLQGLRISQRRFFHTKKLRQNWTWTTVTENTTGQLRGACRGSVWMSRQAPLHRKYSALKPMIKYQTLSLQKCRSPMRVPRTRRSCFVIFRFMARAHTLHSRSLCFAVSA